MFTVSNEVPDYIFAALLVTFAWSTGRAVRARLLQVARLTEAAVRVELEQAERQRAAVTEERARIARELHDVIWHGVTALVIQSAAAQSVVPRDATVVHEALESIQATGRNTQIEMVRLLGLLRQDHAEIGLAPQPGLADIGALVDRARESGVPIELHQETPLPPLSEDLAVTAYRIVQESITNVQRHAGGAARSVTIGCRAGSLTIDVVNAAPREAKRAGAGAGQGLVGMRERADLYNGSVEAGPSPDGGFRVRARLPLDGVSES